MSDKPNSTAQKSRKKKPALLAGRDTFHVIGREGELAVKGEAAHALVVAQKHAERGVPEITVVRRSLFGPATTLYRVTRDEDSRIVSTFTVDAQD